MKKVIVVDDNKLSAEGLCTNIDWNRLGAEVCAAFYHAHDVLACLSSMEVDLIISDISMPGMNGLEMSKLVLQKHPHIKIILISAYDDFEYAKEAVRLGVSDYVEKPIDYGYLTEVIDRTLDKAAQEQRMLSQLKQSRPALIQRFYNDLLAAGPDYAEYHLKDQAEYIGLDLSPASYICVVVRVDNITEAHKNIGIERYHLLMLGLNEELEQLLADQAAVYCLTQGNGMVLIVGFHMEPDRFSRLLHDGLLTLNEKYKNSPLSITIGIGDAVTSIWNVSSSYQNALHAAEYKFIFGEGQIFNILDIRAQNPSPVFFTVGAEEKLIQLISKKDIPAIKQFTQSLIVELSQKYYGRNGVVSYVYSLLARLIRFFYDVGIDSQHIRNLIVDLFSHLEQFQTLDQIFDRVNEICITACEKLQESVATHHQQIAENVVRYIENHYMNADLGLNDIAANVSVSPTYLGALFKKIKGQNISELITQTRIQKASELLSHTNLRILDISEKVGFSNQYYFSAIFKKQTGLTPSEFRAKEH
ncbi:response regulator [Cohnella sp. 56]|uniref:response regulator n=1 Tax=Cohnella sp. 56 TaxID=3113722 RepID=UPI0030EA2481